MKNKTVFIVIGVVLLCCCLVVIVGVVAAPTIRTYLNNAGNGLQNFNPAATASPDIGITPTTSQPSSGGSSASAPVDGGLGDSTLKTDVWNSIIQAESGNSCNDVSSTAISVVKAPNSSGVWTEDWSAKACGKDVVFEITFTPDATGGGTSYSINQK